MTNDTQDLEDFNPLKLDSSGADLVHLYLSPLFGYLSEILLQMTGYLC